MVVLDEIIEKYFNKDSIRHAYLLETNEYEKILTIAKKILLSLNSKIENLEYLLQNGLYPDLKIIEPDGQWIKKEQILTLKYEFKVKSSYNNKRIYIIKNAENLNKSAANTMLKFLEEPEENIIAFLVTSNKSKVLDTLVSRCQHIVLDSNNENDNFVRQQSIDIYNILEEKGQAAGFDIIKILEDCNDRNEIKEILKDLSVLYEHFLLRKMEINVSEKYEYIFDKTLKNNKIEDIQQKINGIILVVDSLEYNINLKLMVDKLVILMFGVD